VGSSTIAEFAVSAVLDELARTRDGFPESELTKARELTRGRTLLRMEDTRNVSSWIGVQELLFDTTTWRLAALLLTAGGGKSLLPFEAVRSFALLPKAREGRPLQVWLTLPATPAGLTPDGVRVTDGMPRAGVAIAGVNVMAMDYGASKPKGPSMGDAAGSALNAARAQGSGVAVAPVKPQGTLAAGCCVMLNG